MKQVQIIKKEVKPTPSVTPVVFPQPEVKECPFRFVNTQSINRYCITGACMMWNGSDCSLYRKGGV